MDPTRRRFVAAGAGLLAAAAGGSLLQSNRLEAVRSAPPGPPRPGRQAVRIALATDMHAPHDYFTAEALAQEVASFDPDILLVVGDALNRRGDEHLVAAYASLPARFGKFAALGNWEYQGDCDIARLRGQYERAGVRLLVNEATTIDVRGEPIRVLGLDDFLQGRPRLDVIARAGHAEARSLVLAHCPILFHDVARVAGSPQLVFAGHTHGGQITPFGHVFMTPAGSDRFVKGWYQAPAGGHHLYVSRGLGNSSVPLRVGSRPEISLLTV